MAIFRKKHLNLIGIVFMLMSGSILAQSEYSTLFDVFNFKFAASWVEMGTELRMDSEATGMGTTLDFEKDLDFVKNQIIPTLGFGWQIAGKHRLGFRWQEIRRASTSRAYTEIQWGDEVVPIDAEISLNLDIVQYFFDYAYFKWGNERWAAGFGGGLRLMDIRTGLAFSEKTTQIEGSSEAKFLGPLPYVYFEYRRILAKDWRIISGLGWLSVKVNDIEGSQVIGRVDLEFLAGERWSLGGTLNFAAIHADWEDVQTQTGDSFLSAKLNMDINDLAIFAQLRF